jgi:hypothetical protein
MLINATKVVRASVDIHHDAPRLAPFLLSLVSIRAHLNPFSIEGGLWFPPLPPLLSTNLLDAVGTQLLLQRFGGARQMVLGNGNIFDFNPLRMRHPLRSESLKFFDSMVRCILQEGSDQVESFIVREMRGWTLSKRFSIEILEVMS